ncbi:MAG: CHASE4 domain-containing protein [Anaerolineae bacterium]
MSIRIKILSVVILFFTVLFIAIYFISSSIITDRFFSLEEEISLSHLKRMTNTLQKDKTKLIREADDYSAWDDSKEFIENKNQEYLDGNFDIFTARSLDINLMVFYDENGNLVHGQSYDLQTGRVLPVSDDIQSWLQQNPQLIAHSTTESQYSGFVKSDERLFFFVSNPILDSFDNGPISGTLIFAQFYDDRRVKALGTLLESDISFLPIGSSSPLESESEVLSELNDESPYFLDRVNRETLYGYGLINDIYGEPIVITQISESRDLYQQGQQSLYLLLGSLLITGLAMSGGLFVLLEFLITRRLGRLIDEVSLIWAQGSNLNLVTTDSQDEISDLGRSINEMIIRLRENREENDELEMALHQASESTRLKSEFLSLVSHELRTPMNAIIGYTEIMLEDVEEELEIDDAKDMLGRIDYSSRHLLSLINEVLDVSKIESGHFQLDDRLFNLQVLLKNLEQQMEILIGDKNLVFSIETTSETPRFFIGDENRLSQILTNLLVNSIKFTSTGFIKLRVGWEDPHLSFAVQDSGMGIPEDAIDYIFMEFRQADSSLNRSYEGSGLGLAIVKKLVDAYDGSIHVESEVGIGSTFMVELPLEIAQP